MLGAVATTLGGAVTGMIVGDSMNAVSMSASVPATGNAAVAKATANGTPVNPVPSAKESLWTSVLIVITALTVLVFGGRLLKDARIG